MSRRSTATASLPSLPACPCGRGRIWSGCLAAFNGDFGADFALKPAPGGAIVRDRPGAIRTRSAERPFAGSLRIPVRATPRSDPP